MMQNGAELFIGFYQLVYKVGMQLQMIFFFILYVQRCFMSFNDWELIFFYLNPQLSYILADQYLKSSVTECQSLKLTKLSKPIGGKNR